MNTSDPIPMLIWCPACCVRHLDEGEFATKPHHTHACQNCGLTWRPAVVPTVGVRFLPGFKNNEHPVHLPRCTVKVCGTPAPGGCEVCLAGFGAP